MRFLKPSLLLNLMVFCALLAFTTQAHALPITPGSEILSGPQNNVQDIEAFINTTIMDFPKLLYKAEVDDGEVTTLALWDSYETEFSATPTDPSGATIEYTGGPIVGSPAYLLVKDGKQDPAFYLFNLSASGWDGMENLELMDFWPRQGAISFVALYGDAAPVPEPSTMLLFFAGLVGFAGFRKMFRKS